MSLFDYYRDALALMNTNSTASTGLPAALGGTDTSAGGVDSEGNITIPNYSFVRERVPGTYDEERRPGSRGQRYFSDYAYTPSGSSAAVRGVAQHQAEALQGMNTRNMVGRPGPVTPPDPTSLGMGTYGANSNPASSVINSNPVPPQGGFSNFTPQYNTGGGIAGVRRYQEGGIIERLAAAGIHIPEEDRELAEQVLGHIPDSIINHPTLGKRYIQQLLAKAKERVGASQGTAPPPREGMMDRLRGAVEGKRSPEEGMIDRPKSALPFADGGAASSSYNRRYNNQNRNGYYLGGPTDGMGDGVPATIDGTQEARLSDGEFVLPADVVSHLGNGNSNAGAQNLYSMMDRVRKARTGNTQQGKEINPNKFIPSR